MNEEVRKVNVCPVCKKPFAYIVEGIVPNYLGHFVVLPSGVSVFACLPCAAEILKKDYGEKNKADYDLSRGRDMRKVFFDRAKRGGYFVRR